MGFFFYNFYVFFPRAHFSAFHFLFCASRCASSTLNIFNGNFMFEIWIHKALGEKKLASRKGRKVDRCVERQITIFQLLKIISNAQFFISNWLVGVYVREKKDFIAGERLAVYVLSEDGDDFDSSTILYGWGWAFSLCSADRGGFHDFLFLCLVNMWMNSN